MRQLAIRLSFLLLAARFSPVALGGEHSVYREDFDRYGDYVASFNEGARIAEWPASLKMLDFNPQGLSEARKDFFRIGTPPVSDTYAIFFRFQMNSPTNRAFRLRLYFGDAAKPETRDLAIDERLSRFNAAADAACKLFAPRWNGFPGPGKWIKGAILVDDQHASFHVVRNGVLVKDCEGLLPSGVLQGGNLISDAPVLLDYVEVVDGCRRPYRIGDPADWIGRSSDSGGTPGPRPGDVALTNGQETAFAPEEGEDLRFQYRAGRKGNVRDALEFVYADGKSAAVSLSIPKGRKSRALRFYDAASGAFTNATAAVEIDDARLSVRGPGFAREVYVAPRLDYRYEEAELAELLAAWEKMPKASEHRLDLRLRPLADNWATNEVWIDSKYAGMMTLPAPPVKIRARLGAEAFLSLRPVRDEMNVFADTRFLPLDVDGLDRPFGTVAPLKGLPDMQKVPFRFARATHTLNLAFCRENLGTFALECNGYLSKSPFDGMPSAMQFSVPVAQYVRAYALCAADPKAPDDFEPVVTARLTHYLDNGARSQAACECTRRLPRRGEPLPEGVTAFGEAADGTPVYQVAFDFDVGTIQDLTSMLKLDRLDLEFIGPLWEKDTYYLSRKRSPSYEKQSSVQIYAVTLEKTPVGLVVTPNRRNSLYYPDEEAGATVSVTPSPYAKGPFHVVATVRDADSEVCEDIVFDTAEPVERKIAFKEKEFGYYSVTYTVSGPDRKSVITHRGSFVLLPPDTRQAGYESPYYIWNFRGAHGTPRELDDWGDMLLRMGVRRTLLPDNLCETNPAVMKYKLTHGEFPFMRPRPKKGQSQEEAEADLKAQMHDKLAKFPHCHTAIIFHESGGGPFPQEVIDGKTEVTSEMAQADTNRANVALTTARLWREVDPSVRLIYGNSGSSLGLVAQLFRAGFPADLIDALGDESVGMTQPPERSVAYPAWALRKLALAYGYTNAVPDAPWEWKSRVVRHLGEEGHAAYCVRSALIALAWGYTCVPVNGLTEMANSYYDTIWGDSSFTRWPLAYPQRTAAATATMTLILDRARFVRMVPTGSLTTYCLEFQKPDGSYVYALWCADDEVRVSALIYPGPKGVTFTDMLGRKRKVLHDNEVSQLNEGDVVAMADNVCYLRVSSSPVYISSAEELIPPLIPPPHLAIPNYKTLPAGAKVVQSFSDTNDAVVVCGHDPRIETGRDDPPFLSFFRPGEFAIRGISRERERDVGTYTCLKLARTTANDCPALVQEYAFLRFPNAKPAPGEPSTVGVWVKGNSSWGKIYFEVTDAEGEKWLSAGTGGYGCMVYDWPEKAALRFDGWKFVQMPLTKDSPVKIYSPGENEWQWQRDGEFGNGRIEYPITVTGLGVGMYPRVLNILKMEETSRTILIGDVVVY